MVRTYTGTVVIIKAFIPHGSTLTEQIDTLTKLKEASVSKDYTALLPVAKILEVRTDQRRMKFEDQQPEQLEIEADTVEETEPSLARRKRA